MFSMTILFAFGLRAQSIHLNYVDGTNSAYNLNDVRKITFDIDVMNLHLWDGSVYAWNVSTIGYYQFDETSLNVQELLNNANAWEVKLYPNPTKTFLTVGFNLLFENEVSIKIFDSQGKLILEKNIGKKESGEHQDILDLTNLPQGTYVCQIAGLQNTITKTVIKN